jgi:hypothetical protein
MIPLDKLVSIQLPPPLKKQLVDDCEFITHLGKVIISSNFYGTPDISYF